MGRIIKFPHGNPDVSYRTCSKCSSGVKPNGDCQGCNRTQPECICGAFEPTPYDRE